MAYREDLDAFAQQRVRETSEAALFASFRRAETARRRRTLVKWLGGLVVVCAIYGGSLAAPLPARHSAVLVRLREASVSDLATYSRRACARRAVHDYLAWMRTAQPNVAGDPGPHYKLADFARSCPRASNSN